MTGELGRGRSTFATALDGTVEGAWLFKVDAILTPALAVLAAGLAANAPMMAIVAGARDAPDLARIACFLGHTATRFISWKGCGGEIRAGGTKRGEWRLASGRQDKQACAATAASVRLCVSLWRKRARIWDGDGVMWLTAAGAAKRGEARRGEAERRSGRGTSAAFLPRAITDDDSGDCSAVHAGF